VGGILVPRYRKIFSPTGVRLDKCFDCGKKLDEDQDNMIFPQRCQKCSEKYYEKMGKGA
jgi:DNA-directed RNA polymerase subunit RPC12/RpoP|tara:strand:- start:1219 stop:1395 length:177 start_codon:yes stop_codon:yes gene_type:complete